MSDYEPKIRMWRFTDKVKYVGGGLVYFYFFHWAALAIEAPDHTHPLLFFFWLLAILYWGSLAIATIGWNRLAYFYPRLILTIRKMIASWQSRQIVQAASESYQVPDIPEFQRHLIGTYLVYRRASDA